MYALGNDGLDCYVVTRWTLRYTLILQLWVYVQLAAASWSSGLANSLLQVARPLQLFFCGKHTLDHFFCEMPALIKLTWVTLLLMTCP
jgi:olfactory receptor